MSINPLSEGPNSLLHLNNSSTVPNWLDGKQVTLSSTFDVCSPLDGSTLYRASSASEEDAYRAVESANQAFKSWSQTKPRFRRDIFLRASELFIKRGEELKRYSMTETGATESVISLDLDMAADACKSVAGLIQVTGTSTSPVVAEEGSSSIVSKEPFGVILGIAPWNAPYVLGLRACLQPLAMGNTVILKGPEASPGTYWAISSVLHEAGLPAGCLNTIYHRPTDAARITAALVAHPLIKKINFTGSTAVGSVIASLAGKHLKPTIMELGGKASAIVCEDANLQLAAKCCALGAFVNAGQICMSTERILVHVNVADSFRLALEKTLATLYPEAQDSTKKALPLISRGAVDKNKKLVADALSKGAKILWGEVEEGDPPLTHQDELTSKGTRISPVVLENIKPEMDIYGTESFGPTASLIVVQSDEEAITLANDTEYGLTSAVFTQDLRRGLRMAKAIESGAVHINSMTVHDEPALPHGGKKKSGFGRFNGVEGLGEWVSLKTITWRD